MCPRQLYTGKLHVGGKIALNDKLGLPALHIFVSYCVHSTKLIYNF